MSDNESAFLPYLPYNSVGFFLRVSIFRFVCENIYVVKNELRKFDKNIRKSGGFKLSFGFCDLNSIHVDLIHDFRVEFAVKV